MFNYTPHQQENNQYYVYGTIVIAIVALIIILVKNRLKQPKYFVDYDTNFRPEELYYGVYKRMLIGFKHTNNVYGNRKDADKKCKELNDKQIKS